MKKWKKVGFTYFFCPFVTIIWLFSSFFYVFVAFLSFPCVAYTQQTMDADLQEVFTLLQDLLENQEEISDFQLNTIYEEFLNKLEQPQDLNKATFEDLYALIFLSDIEINNILRHRASYNGFLDIYELQAVEGLSLNKAKLLSKLFFVNDAIQARTNINTPKSTIFLKSERKLQTERGYISQNNLAPAYVGDPTYLYMRLAIKNIFSWNLGLTLEKDAGEAWNEQKDGISDFKSLYLAKEDISNSFKSLIIGDFVASFGQGLILQNGFGLGKSSYTTSLKRGTKSIRPYSSADENIFFRGIATQWQLGNGLHSTMLASRSKIDGNLIFDSDGTPMAFSSFQRSGLHRTNSELVDKDGVVQWALASSISRQWLNGSKVALNALYLHYSLELDRAEQPYNLFRLEGDRVLNLSTDYNFYWNSINIFGEIAYASTGGWAKNINAVTSLHPKLDIAINYRDYDKSYQAPLSNAFGESSVNENEEGFYLGLEMRPNRAWQISAFADFWDHEWLKFGIDAPSDGTEFLLKIENSVKRRRSSYLQYRYERKQRNSSADSRTSFITDVSLHRLRLQNDYILKKNWTLKSRAELSFYEREGITTNGYMVYQDVVFNAIQVPISCNARIAYFDIDNFDTRIYAFEKDLLYEFSIPFFSGQGWRYYLFMQYKVNKHLTTEMRWSNTHYTDYRTSIGSGNSTIEGNNLTQLKAQIRYSF